LNAISGSINGPKASFLNTNNGLAIRAFEFKNQSKGFFTDYLELLAYFLKLEIIHWQYLIL
jgi:hypothetical protein